MKFLCLIEYVQFIPAEKFFVRVTKVICSARKYQETAQTPIIGAFGAENSRKISNVRLETVMFGLRVPQDHVFCAHVLGILRVFVARIFLAGTTLTQCHQVSQRGALLHTLHCSELQQSFLKQQTLTSVSSSWSLKTILQLFTVSSRPG